MIPLQVAVLGILDNAPKFHWSLQGMGLLRLYVRDVGRIHIWDETLRYSPDVSMMHNHSWDLHSTIVAGRLQNTRYVQCAEDTKGAIRYHTKTFITGYDAHATSDQETVCLCALPPETYTPIMDYRQKAHEVHRTDALDGTVTVLLRKDDEEGHANIYWPEGTEWVSATPRPARPEELRVGVKKAIAWLTAV